MPSLKKKPTFGDSSKPEIEVVEKAKKAPSIKKTPTFGDSKSESDVTEKAKRAPSMKKRSTFPDQSIDTRTPKAPEVPVSAPVVQPTRQSSSQPGMAKAPHTMKPGNGNSDADIWEKEQMEKINERYHAKLIDITLENTHLIPFSPKRTMKGIYLHIDNYISLFYYMNYLNPFLLRREVSGTRSS